MEKIDISVIMPVYNVEKYLNESLNSILSQSLKNLEIICIDDGSTDSSYSILKKFQKKDDRIKIIKQSNNGAGHARNVGLNHATGKYVYFMDSDDILKINALKELYTVAEDKQLDIVLFKLLNMYDDTNETFKSEYYDMDFLNKIVKDKIFNYEDVGNYIFNITVSPPGKLFKRNLIKNIKFPEGIMLEDNVFFTKALFKSKRMYFYDKYLYYRRIRENSVSFADTSRLTDSIIILNQMEEILHEFGLFEKYSYAWFTKKINMEHYRFTLVETIYKQDFYNKMRLDFQKHKIEYESNPNFQKIEDRLKRIFYTVLSYKSYKDFESSFNQSISYNVKISVVVPVYNASNFLDESIPSLLNQTFKDFEVLCVNDGSKDNSLEILNRFSQIDPRIKVIDKENGGCGSARNKGLDLVKGDYVYFFDPDDYILPNTFEELYKNSINNNSDMVMFKIARFRDGEPINYSIPGFDFENVFKNIDFNNFTFNYKKIKSYVLNRSFAPWTKLYKRELIESNHLRFETNVAFDDVPFHVQSIIKANKISFVPDFFYHYRLSNPNSVNNTASNGIDIFKICDIVQDFLEKNKLYEIFKQEYELFKIVQIFNYLISTNTDEYFQKAKYEINNLDISNNNLIDKNLRNKIDLINNSSSLNEYIQKFNKKELNNLNQKIFDLNSEITILKNELKSKNDNLNKINKENILLKNKVSSLENENSVIKHINQLLFNSNSWKITRPIRAISNKLKK